MLELRRIDDHWSSSLRLIKLAESSLPTLPRSKVAWMKCRRY